jgi:uncharacterized membrane protein (DUF4010 family)
MTPIVVAERLGLLIALACFLGLAFEEIYKRTDRSRPGGIRTFPILALTGAGLYLVDQEHGLAFVAGLIAIAAWLYPYIAAQQPSFIVPASHLLAYTLGGIALSQSEWMPVAITVTCVLFLSARTQMHRLVRLVPQEEVLIAGQFLLLVGIILPIAPNELVVPEIPVTPFQLWLAVVAVSATAYVSYLVERYVPSPNTVMLPAVMGGLYSSTAITIVLARRLGDGSAGRSDVMAGITAATAVMYIRIGIIVALFDRGLALKMVPPLGVLCLCGALVALWQWRRQRPSRTEGYVGAGNPLQITAALVFAAGYLIITMLSNWVKASFGAGGVIALALVVGLTDIAPFVTSLAQGGTANADPDFIVSAVLTAASSNNLLKAAYAVALGGRRAALQPAAILAALAVLGFAGAAIYGLGHPLGP